MHGHIVMKWLKQDYPFIESIFSTKCVKEYKWNMKQSENGSDEIWNKYEMEQTSLGEWANELRGNEINGKCNKINGTKGKWNWRWNRWKLEQNKLNEGKWNIWKTEQSHMIVAKTWIVSNTLILNSMMGII